VKKSIDDVLFWGIVVVCAILLFGVAWTIVVAEAPRYIAWDASQFMAKAKVTRYLLNGSSIEHRFVTVKARSVCNGWIADPPVQTCALRLDDTEDLEYSYRIREFDASGKQVADRTCVPMETRWQCLPTVRDPR